jgi:hypothetical protein
VGSLTWIMYLIQKYLGAKHQGAHRREAVEKGIGVDGGPKILVRIWYVMMALLVGVVILGLVVNRT